MIGAVDEAKQSEGRSAADPAKPGSATPRAGPTEPETEPQAKPEPAVAPMNLKILLPFQVFAEKTGVSRIVAETREGSFGLLPHRLDCVAALAPGILTYETDAEGEVYVAVDEGVLVKTGAGRAGLGAPGDRRNGPRSPARGGGAGVSDIWTSRSRACVRCWRNWKAGSSAASRPFTMSDELRNQRLAPKPSLGCRSRSARRRRASSRRRRQRRAGVWFGLGMMGLIGWSVAVPTLLGAALGLWLDQHYPGRPFLDAGAAGGRAGPRLLECLALGAQGRAGPCGRNRRIAMHELADTGCWRAWPGRCSARSSSAACGGRCAQGRRPAGRRCGFSAACCCGLSVRARGLLCRSGPGTGSGCWRACWAF